MQQLHIVKYCTALLLVFIMSVADAFAENHTPDYYDYNVRDHFRHQRWEAGKKILDQGMVEYGTLSVMNELQGWYYYHLRKYTQARYYLTRSLRDDKANQHSRELLVNVEEETRNYSSAVCYINEILEYNPYAKGWWRRKINLYQKMGNYQEADRLLARLRQIYPNDIQIKKDIAYQTELNYVTYKRKGDTDGMARSLRQLIHANPKNPEYYLNLTNLLLQQGKTSDAAEIAAQGARSTRSMELVRKRVGILAEQGRHSEAIAYLQELKSTMRMGGLDKMINDLEEDAAVTARNNDPYVMYGRIYGRTKNPEALTFLLNTALSRGYYDDALEYLGHMKKTKGQSFDILYKEYIIHKRLGNTLTANRLLRKLADMRPNETDIKDELCAMYFAKANEAMEIGSYEDAIEPLKYCESNSSEKDIRNSASKRIFNCHLELKDYASATAQLEKNKELLDSRSYILQKANLLKQQNKVTEALKLLKEEYMATNDEKDLYAISSYYEELVVPRIKSAIEAKTIKQANVIAMDALEVCPNSYDILRYAINTSDILGKKEDFIRLVNIAKEKYPGDPYVIVKEASIYTMTEDYASARSLIRPLLDVYIGDSTIINAFAETSNQFSLQQRKNKNLNHALESVSEALEYKENDRDLMYTKGLIFEDLKMYDSAFFYQRKYVPSILEVSEFKHHLEELIAKGYDNALSFDYSHAVNGQNNKRTGTANASYTRSYEKNSYEYSVGYAGRDGMADVADDVETQEPGGTGLQLGLTWTHQWKQDISWTVGGSVATKYFPLFSLKLAVDFTDVPIKWLKDEMFDIQPHITCRMVRGYNKLFRAITDDTWVPTSIEEVNDTLVAQFAGYKEKLSLLTSAGVTVSKALAPFNLSAGADLFLRSTMNSASLYYSVNGKMQFFPVDGNTSNVFVMGGFGTAPEASIIDNSMPGVFDQMNTYVGMGGLYLLNRYLTFGLSGTWYTLYDQNEVLVNPSAHYPYAPKKFPTKYQTKFSNYFYLNASLLVHF